ncbi:MAG: DUF3108 domain-containing protein, partial [Candidatus Omnitrophica bacterium]|nr:DUF3108 domain-containing protein [Candidatus Omnitrophota bacterium]
KNVEIFQEKTIVEALENEAGLSVKTKKYTYLMAWNSIPVGSIYAQVGPFTEYQGKKVLMVSVKTESNKFLSKIYRIDDVFISYIDLDTFRCIRHEANRKEGNYRKNLIIDYDFENLTATYSNLKDGSVKKCEILPDSHDILSVIIEFTTLPVKPGETLHMELNLNEKNYDLYGYVESLEVVILPGKKYVPAFKIKPYAMLDGKKYERGKGYLYFSADKNRDPIYGAVEIPFGKVTATLKSIDEI